MEDKKETDTFYQTGTTLEAVLKMEAVLKIEAAELLGEMQEPRR